MNIQPTIDLKLAGLPPAMQQEVIDFTNFLLEKCRSQQVALPATKVTAVEIRAVKPIGQMAPTFLPPSVLEEASVPSIYQGPPLSLEAMRAALEEEAAHHI